MKASVNTEVFNIPVSIEGFYTTQDKNRTAKASYLRLHYDAGASKDRLQKKISAFNNTYTDVVAQQKAAANVYQPYMNKLEQQSQSMQMRFKKDNGISCDEMEKYDGNIDKYLQTNIIGDSLEEKLKQNKEKISREYHQLKTTKKEIDKYDKIMHPNGRSMYFDSAITYTKLQELSKIEDVSYRQLVKASEDILPKSTNKHFFSGLTNLDVGILNKYESKYTMSGQVLKGVNVGYDINLFKITASAGKTEYVSRDGNVDRYNSYSVRLDVKQIKRQKFGVIYYSYNPTRKVFSAEQFSDIQIPTFNNPVQIYSVDYNGSIGRNILLSAEAATSQQKNDRIKIIDKNNSALITSVEFFIPHSTLSINGSWEHVGSKFENNTTPYNNAGTEQYTNRNNQYSYTAKCL